ncbi:MAG: hypothetical protein K8I82_29265 [Anaerolineae bacterium]|nr:hypothetical protein [Anaerolineae bacterium]
MFNQLTHQQHLADFIKSILYKHGRTPEQRRIVKPVLADLNQFEGKPWIPQAFEQAVSEVAPGWLRYEDGEFAYEPRRDAVEIIQQILARYAELIGEQREAV